ncbi:MAG: hypothetical protein NT161_02110 [Candidatus Nomurabacteria bacterium]|nr:hypothetical protein [Candidatus Nomurabacteria bacterium]
MDSIKAGWSGRLTRNGTMKNEFTCNSCRPFPACIKICNLSDDFPVFCKDKLKRKEREKFEKEKITELAIL